MNTKKLDVNEIKENLRRKITEAYRRKMELLESLSDELLAELLESAGLGMMVTATAEIADADPLQYNRSGYGSLIDAIKRAVKEKEDVQFTSSEIVDIVRKRHPNLHATSFNCGSAFRRLCATGVISKVVSKGPGHIRAYYQLGSSDRKVENRKRKVYKGELFLRVFEAVKDLKDEFSAPDIYKGLKRDFPFLRIRPSSVVSVIYRLVHLKVLDLGQTGFKTVNPDPSILETISIAGRIKPKTNSTGTDMEL